MSGQRQPAEVLFPFPGTSLCYRSQKKTTPSLVLQVSRETSMNGCRCICCALHAAAPGALGEVCNARRGQPTALNPPPQTAPGRRARQRSRGGSNPRRATRWCACARRTARRLDTLISQNVSIKWFLYSQFTHKPVNLILLFLVLLASFASSSSCPLVTLRPFFSDAHALRAQTMVVCGE